jgi:thymidylate kinase
MPQKIVVALEGMDGAGKSSLALFARKLCEEHGQPFTLIGRREVYANPLIGRLTRLLAEEAGGLSPAAETCVRLAREHERAALAAQAQPGIVILDRFVLSCLALARFHGQDVEPLTGILREITYRANLHATVLVRVPFEIAWDRVKARRQMLGHRKPLDEHQMRRMATLLEEEFERGQLSGQQWIVDNTQPIVSAEEQLANYLAAHFQKGRPRTAAPLEGTGDESVLMPSPSSLSTDEP